MKRLILVVVLFFTLIGSPVFGQQWVTANQATIAWDAVTATSDGTPIPAGEKIRYVVYIANADTDPSKANATEVATTEGTQQAVTLAAEGRFFVGVKADRLRVDNGAVLSSSIIAWSDDAAYCQGGQTFGLRYFKSPGAPTGLRPSGG